MHIIFVGEMDFSDNAKTAEFYKITQGILGVRGSSSYCSMLKNQCTDKQLTWQLLSTSFIKPG
jgi:hypothetical protein